MSSSQRTTRITIRNDIADLARVRDALDRFAGMEGVSPTVLAQLHVVLDELVSNVIKYAWPRGEAHELSVSFTRRGTSLEVEIVDDGAPFDPCSVASPRPRVSGERREHGGVGIHMVRQLVDHIEYARMDGRNHVKLLKHSAGAAQPQTGE